MPKFNPEPSALYFTDNGRIVCGEHLGMTARFTGRDISGQRIVAVKPRDLAEFARQDFVCRCERCGKGAHSVAGA